ncbi:MAG TPA: ATP-binding protein [Longimicrobium sp.]|jgi:ATP-dependent DNA helicase RecG|uniref:ATP-binding protein n=1 Tax=Longimicrobium sp. TaxID=2029185 RepID=UPI002ED8878C
MTEVFLTPDLREGEQIEFKVKWNDKAVEDLCAFANTRGGNLFVGIDDDRTVAGMSGSDAEMQSITSAISNTLGISPRVEWGTAEGKTILVISVEPTDWVVACKGRHYTRVGSTNREMPREELTRRMLRQIGSSWDALTTSASIDEIDTDSLRRFAALSKPRIPYLDPDQPSEIVLDKLDLVREGSLTHAGLLLFGREPQRSYRTALVRIARVHDGEILSEHVQTGNLFAQLDGVMDALRTRFLDVRYEMPSSGSGVEGMQRQEIWEYPYVALREAINNALVHRDYMVPGDIQIRLYDDRLEIWNPGPLINDLDPALLRIDPHPSRRRNELIAEIFHAAGLIERWGTGTLRMIKACRQQDLPEPEFVDKEGGGFKVIFRRDRYSADQLRRLELNERQIQAVLSLRAGGVISNSEYQNLTGSEKRTASRDLTDLVDRGIFERVGSTGRGVRYRVRR